MTPARAGSNERPPQRSFVHRTVMWASGYDEALATTAGELRVASATGSAVLATGCMAAVSMTFALVMSVGHAVPVVVCVIFALFYGLVIVTIDRFFVMLPLRAFRFPANDPEEPEVVKEQRGSVVLAALPRLVLSVVIGFVIAEPILLTVFAPEISQRVEQMQAALAEEAVDAVQAEFQAAESAQPEPSNDSVRLQEITTTLLPAVKDDISTTSAEKLREEELAQSEERGDRVHPPGCGRAHHRQVGLRGEVSGAPLASQATGGPDR